MTSLHPTTIKPEDICVSLETAKRLKEAGWPQEMGNTYFVWRDFMHYGEFKVTAWPLIKLHEPHYAAPTAEEVLMKLGTGRVYFHEGQFICALEGDDIGRKNEPSSSMAEAIAMRWIQKATNTLP